MVKSDSSLDCAATFAADALTADGAPAPWAGLEAACLHAGASARKGLPACFNASSATVAGGGDAQGGGARPCPLDDCACFARCYECDAVYAHVPGFAALFDRWQARYCPFPRLDCHPSTAQRCG